MSYWNKLKGTFDAVVKDYQDDFLIHDKQDLDGYGGRLLWCARKSGTRLVLFDACENTPRATQVDITTAMNVIQSNETFVIGENGNVRTVNYDQAIAYLRKTHRTNSTATFL